VARVDVWAFAERTYERAEIVSSIWCPDVFIVGSCNVLKSEGLFM
jgi:hypothetical protein